MLRLGGRAGAARTPPFEALFSLGCSGAFHSVRVSPRTKRVIYVSRNDDGTLERARRMPSARAADLVLGREAKTTRRAAPKLDSRLKMILTQCAVCATDLGLTLGKKCGRCSTRYCGPECQKQHWEGGGHDTLCKNKSRRRRAVSRNHEVHGGRRGRGRERADDTRARFCYICTQALHWKTKEGLVRGCACRGTANSRTCRAWRSRRRFCGRGRENNLDA